MLDGQTGAMSLVNRQTTTDRPTRTTPLDPPGISGVLWESALDSFVRTILVLVFGSVVIGLLGGLLHDMFPSAPPGVSGETPSISRLLSRWDESWSWFEGHRFLIIFCVVFGLTVRMRLKAGQCSRDGALRPPTRARRMGRKISQDWFGMIVGNAFGAFISATVIVWVQQFSATNWVLRSIWSAFGPAIQSFSNAVLGPARVDALQGWLDWYNLNQLKFVFWFLYLAAICDDLGIPNWKTLVRWLWRKRRHRPQPEPQSGPVPNEPPAPADPVEN